MYWKALTQAEKQATEVLYGDQECLPPGNAPSDLPAFPVSASSITSSDICVLTGGEIFAEVHLVNGKEVLYQLRSGMSPMKIGLIVGGVVAIGLIGYLVLRN